MIRATDLYMTRALQLMLKDIRQNRFLIDDILCDVTSDPILKDLYGKKEVDKFNLLIDKEIQINVEHTIDVAKLPAIAVRVGGGTEDASKTGDAIGDGYRQEEVKSNTLGGVMVTPRVIIGPTTPESFDYMTGKIVFPDNIDLSRVYDEMIVYDEINKKGYPIITVMNESTLFIEGGHRPNLTRMTIRSKNDNALHTRKEYFANEQVTFICCATDPVEVIYLYQFVLYMIGRHRLNLFETKNFRTGTIQYTPIYKLADEPNLVFARDITISGTVEHSYIENTSRPIDGLGTNVRIADAGTTPAGYINEVSGQGWKLEDDE